MNLDSEYLLHVNSKGWFNMLGVAHILRPALEKFIIIYYSLVWTAPLMLGSSTTYHRHFIHVNRKNAITTNHVVENSVCWFPLAQESCSITISPNEEFACTLLKISCFATTFWYEVFYRLIIPNFVMNILLQFIIAKYFTKQTAIIIAQRIIAHPIRWTETAGIYHIYIRI